MQKEDTYLFNAHSYYEQAHGEIANDKTSISATRNVSRHSMSGYLIHGVLCSQ